jgi:uncharacterized protein
MNWALIRDVVWWAADSPEAHRDCKLRFHITSNLTILPDDVIEVSKKYGITYLVNIDGDERIHNRMRPAKARSMDSFQKTRDNFKALVSAGIVPGCRMTVTTENVGIIDEVCRVHRELGAGATAIVAVNPINSDGSAIAADLIPSYAEYSSNLRKAISSGVWGPAEIAPFNGYMREFRPKPVRQHACGAPLGATPVVDVDGNIFPCIYVVGNSKYGIGNVFKGEWNTNAMEAIANHYHIGNLSGCNTCAYRNFCAGHCYTTRFLMKADDAISRDAAERRNALSCATTKTCIQYLLECFFEDYLEAAE